MIFEIPKILVENSVLQEMMNAFKSSIEFPTPWKFLWKLFPWNVEERKDLEQNEAENAKL